MVVPFPGAGDERDSAAEVLRDEIMDDVQTEPGTALRTSGRDGRATSIRLVLGLYHRDIARANRGRHSGTSAQRIQLPMALGKSTRC
jgi:hypothetical protein